MSGVDITVKAEFITSGYQFKPNFAVRALLVLNKVAIVTRFIIISETPIINLPKGRSSPISIRLHRYMHIKRVS
jgi:hypothetical protein